jgi:transposase-like protein
MAFTRKSSRFARISKSFNLLSPGEQQRLFYSIKDYLFPDTKPDIHGRIKDIREARNAGGMACPHCGGQHVVRFGKYGSRQRYRCQETACRKTFNDTTLSPLAGTHYPDKWLKCLQYMISGKPLRAIAEKLEIHLSTAFYWRHKILSAIRAKGFDGLAGVVESDETYFRESNKGHRNIKNQLGRKPRKRGKKATKRGISSEQVCVLVAQDRQGHVFSQVAGNGRISAVKIDSLIGRYSPYITALCTDAESPYRKFAKDAGLEHHQINAKAGERVKKGIFHIQHVNAHHSRLKGWLHRFNGVATRWLDNYLAWFRFIDLHGQIDRKEVIHEMLVDACVKPTRCSIAALRPQDAGNTCGS